jgi:hypothetical protein
MTNLQLISNGSSSTSLSSLGGDSELVQDIQERLGKIGFVDLDAVTLGVLSQATEKAIEKFQGVARRSPTDDVDESFAKKLIDITKDVDLPIASNSDVVISLIGTVGKNSNNSSDVLAVKNRLADLGFRVARDSTTNSSLMNAIKLFQAIINDRKSVDAGGIDGIIDVDGKTHKALQKSYAPRWQEMLPGSVQEGFLNSDYLAKQDSGDFGTTWMVEAIQAAGLIYKNNYLQSHPKASLIAVNDISKSTGGDFSPHQEHQVGLCCDLYLPRLDGNAGAITVNDNQYDQDAMKAILESFHFQTAHPIAEIFLNDSDLQKIRINGVKLCSPSPGHENHAHVRIRPKTLSRF